MSDYCDIAQRYCTYGTYTECRQPCPRGYTKKVTVPKPDSAMRFYKKRKIHLIGTVGPSKTLVLSGLMMTANKLAEEKQK